MLKIEYHNKFKKDYKQIIKRGYNVKDFETVVTLLANEKQLPEKYRDHELKGNYVGFRECHIAPDWLLIYRIDKNILTLTLVRTGTNSDLF